MKIPAVKRNYFLHSFYILLLVLFGVSTAAAGTKLTLNSGTAEPFITEGGGGFYGDLVKEVFSRLDIDAKVIRLPSSRSLINANNGIDAGVIARTKGIDKKYKNLIRVPSSILTFKFVAYSLDEKIKVTDWDSFKPYSVGMIRGWVIYEKNVKKARKITKVVETEQLFNLLMNKRTDLILFEYYRGNWWNNHLNAQAHIIGSPIAEKEMYLYMHKQHADLVPKITRVLDDLKKDGTYQRIKDKSLTSHLN